MTARMSISPVRGRVQAARSRSPAPDGLGGRLMRGLGSYVLALALLALGTGSAGSSVDGYHLASPWAIIPLVAARRGCGEKQHSPESDNRRLDFAPPAALRSGGARSLARRWSSVLPRCSAASGPLPEVGRLHVHKCDQRRGHGPSGGPVAGLAADSHGLHCPGNRHWCGMRSGARRHVRRPDP